MVLLRQLDGFVEYIGTQVNELSREHPLKALNKAFSEAPNDGRSLMQFALTAKRLSQKNFLSHLKIVDNESNNLRRQSRWLLSPEKLISGYRTTKFMSQDLIADMLEIGFVRDEGASLLHEREDITPKMIFLLMAGGGVRRSEPFHMWFNDVQVEDIDGRQRCIPYIRHPSSAPTFIHGVKGDRMAYLAERGMLPRHQSRIKSWHAGWKNLPLDLATKSASIFFLHDRYHKLFANYFACYLHYRRLMIKERLMSGLPDHPFLFVSSGDDRNSDITYVGAPYSMSALSKAFERALVRVEKSRGEKIDRGKNSGNTPHGLRHAYAHALANSGVPTKAIQRAMNHISVLSQAVYTEPTYEQINSVLTKAGDVKGRFSLESDDVAKLIDTWKE